MDPTALAAQKVQAAGKDYLTIFAEALVRFATPSSVDEPLAQVPALLVSGFDATRAELWLWDPASGSAYLTHAAGQEGAHRRDFAEAGSGAVGRMLQQRQPLENGVLAQLDARDQEFAARSGLTHVCAYPLLVQDNLLGVLAAYSHAEVEEQRLKWWRAFAEVASATVHQTLTAQESRRTITQLSLLFEATRLLNSTLDLAELLELILKIARNEVGADRGTVFLVDAKRRELWSIVASGLDHQEIRVPYGKGVAGRVAETGEVVNVEDAYTLPYFEPAYDRKYGYRTRSLLCLPIRHRTGEIVGVIQLLNQRRTGRFTPEDQEFLEKLSGHMAMALENARLHRDALEKQRLEKELALARNIQRSLLPDSPPVVPGYEIGVMNESCFEVGGDYYDFLSLGPQSLLLVVADVEGKGVSSAMVMSNLQATLRALVMHLHSLEVLTLSLNEMIYNDTKSQKYLSIFLGLVDTRRNGLHYINAGHVPPLLIDGATGRHRTLDKGGIVVGLFPTAEYERGSERLNPGDILLCCTDGITEACNAQEEEYGAERMVACAWANRARSAQGIVEAILQEVNAFAARGLFVDDKVLMVLKVSGDLAPPDIGATTRARVH